jgi:hypothetical protein
MRERRKGTPTREEGKRTERFQGGKRWEYKSQ